MGETEDGAHPHGIFVYGTLRRGRCRERCWPHPPLSIELAFVAGRLYDFGDYPGMVAGDNWVGGELWTFTPEHMGEIFQVLDEIEDFRGRNDDLYKRLVFDCHIGSPQQRPIRAFTYVYAQDLTVASQIRPNLGGVCWWPPELELDMD